jgi:hypothetical protein
MFKSLLTLLIGQPFIIGLCLFSYKITAQLPTNLLPLDNANVTNPVSFSWLPTNGNNDIYLNVSTSPTMATVDVANWHDDGTHYFTANSSYFSAHTGKRLYWRVASQGIFSSIRSFVVGDISIDPYYNLQHMGWPANQFWQPTDTSTMPLSQLTDMKVAIGGAGNTPDRKLGFSVTLPYFYTSDPNDLKKSIIKLCKLAEQSDMAIFFTLDGYEFWNGRPDLWNWWDATKSGYNPANVQNVEWLGWNSSDAVKNGYRNWGAAFNAGIPHPNLASPVLIAESRKALFQLCPLIRDWYNGLPENKKYLFAGVKISWELGIGVNYYYPKSAQDTTTIAGSKQIGYAAVKTLGLANSGAITANQLDAVVQNYSNQLAEVVLLCGIPRRKVFTHTGGENAPVTPVLAGTNSAFSTNASPGWSFYTGNAGPTGLVGFEQNIKNAGGNTWWAVAEWGGGNLNTALAFENFYNNKMINSYVPFSHLQTVFTQLINTTPQNNSRHNWLHPPKIKHTVGSTEALLNWSIPSQAGATYLNISTSSKTNAVGSLLSANVANEVVTNTYSKTLSNLAPGTYYTMLIADGFGRRVLSDIDSFTIISIDPCVANPLPAPTIAGTLTVCTGQTTILTASGGATYKWSNGATTPSVSVGIGTYSVTATSTAGCMATKSATVAAQATTITLNNCPANITLSSPNSDCLAATWTAPMATANCGTPSVSSNYNPGFCFPVGTTTVTYTATVNGVSKICSFTITVTKTDPCAANPLFTPTIIGELSLCSSNTRTTLTATNGGTYKWNTGATSSSITAGFGIYSVTVTNVNGCTAVKSVIVTSSAVTAAITGATNVCGSNKTTLTASGGTAYKWSNGATTPSVSVGIGAYNVLITQNGCSAMKSVTVKNTRLACFGIFQLQSNNVVLDLTAQSDLHRVRLGWVNNTGDDNDYFDVEKFNTTTGDFDKLTTLNSKSGDDLAYYNAFDESPTDGDNTYRINLISKDGTTKTSNLSTVKFTKTPDFRIFPNPASDYIDVDLKQYAGKAVTLQVYNSFGKLMTTQQVDRATSATVHVELGAQASGEYLLRVTTQGRRDVVKKFVVQQ